MTGSLPPFAAARIAREEKAERRVLEAGLWTGPATRISKLVWDRAGWVAYTSSGSVQRQEYFPLGLHVSLTGGAITQSPYELVAWPPPPDSDPCASTGHVWVDVDEVDGGVLRRCDVCEDELVEHPDGTTAPVRKVGEP